MIKLDENAYCLSCNLNRFHYLQKCFESVGLKPPTLFPGAILNDGASGCLIGHISIVMMARSLNLPYIVVYEDDAYPRKDVIHKFNLLVNELDSIDPNWGMLSIGRSGEISGWDGNTQDFWIKYKTDEDRNCLKSKVVDMGNFLSIPKNSNGSHSYIVRNWCYNEWLYSLTRNRYSDIAMAQCNFTKNKVYWTKELLFTTKQIDNKCMTNLFVDEVSFIYPYNYNKDYSGAAHISTEPPKGFVFELVV
jgi:hypothetical protein